MTNENTKKTKILLFFIFISFILAANYILFRIPVLGPVPSGAVIGSILDFMIVIPLLAYFFIIRKRYSLKYLGFVIAASYGAAYFIIPNEHFSQYSFLPYIVFLSEGLLILVELFILYKVISKLPRLIRNYRSISNQDSLFQLNVKRTVKNHLPNNRLIAVFLSELSIFYYSLFAWRKKVNIQNGHSYTYHKKTSVNAVYIMLIHATVIESIGFHYFLHQWNEMASYILLFLNLYAILYFLAEIHAIRLTPFVLSRDCLLLQPGFSKSMELPLEIIKEIKYYDGPEKLNKKELNELFDARVIDFFQEKPQFEINLKEPQVVNFAYGIKKEVKRIILNVDDPDGFYQAIQKRIVMVETVSE
ncbi:hypothetical protein LIS82_14315 [Cytobacillus solani]|uniref:hypothetical protein n=1 Tax=Cytobacillus solani TaxID=1637975 RepID=UPI002079D599|nr:hypothetical protein [Cytobacillus solani]USK52809.1 hypothetical protein LIS82_14315 [Cytobacillus solani]